MATLVQLAIGYVAERRQTGELATESARSVRATLNGFCRIVGPVPPRHLGPEHVEQWLRASRFAPEAARSSVSRVRMWCRWMIRRGYIKADPTADLRLPRRPRRLPRGLPRHDVEVLLRSCPDVQTELIVLLMCQEGLRCCEVAGLTVGDVDFVEELLIVTGKGQDQRVLPISTETMTAIRIHLGSASRKGPLIRHPAHHHAMTPRYVSQLVNRMLREADIAATAHALRHTALTDMLKCGAHLLDVQAAAGHADLSTTRLYLPWLVNDLRTAMGGRTYRPSGH
jgi:site-specific recombinase XerD